MSIKEYKSLISGISNLDELRAEKTSINRILKKDWLVKYSGRLLAKLKILNKRAMEILKSQKKEYINEW